MLISKSVTRYNLQIYPFQIVDFENGVNPFASPEEDSGSDLELDEDELKRAAKRLKLLERKYADEAESFVLPDKEEQGENYADEFEIEGGEDDLEEFERTFVGKKKKRGRTKRRKWICSE